MFSSAREIYLGEAEFTAAGADIHFKVQGKRVAYFKVPGVVGTDHKLAAGILSEIKFADPIADRVIDVRGKPAVAVVEVTFEHALGATAHADFASGHFHRHSDGLGALGVHRLRVVIARRGGAGVFALGEGVAAGHQEEHDENEKDRADGRTNRKRWRIAGILRLARSVPDHAGADKDEDEGPVAADDRPGMKIRERAGEQHHHAERDEKQGEDNRAASDTTILGHGPTSLLYRDTQNERRMFQIEVLRAARIV